jgi:hypothetical protein
MTPDLLRCPFCGYENPIYDTLFVNPDANRATDKYRGHCPICRGSGSWKDTKEEAGEAWNTRCGIPANDTTGDKGIFHVYSGKLFFMEGDIYEQKADSGFYYLHEAAGNVPMRRIARKLFSEKLHECQEKEKGRKK